MSFDRVNIKIVVDTKVAIEGLDKLEKKLEEIGDTLSKKIGKGFDKLADALGKVKVNLKFVNDQSVKVTNTLKQSFTQANKQTNTLNIRLAKQGKEIAKNTSKMGAYAAAIRWVSLAAMRGIHDIGRFISRSSQDIGKALGGALTKGGAGLKGIGSSQLAGNVLSPVVSLVRGTINKAVSGVEAILKGATTAVTAFAGGVAKTLGALIQTISGGIGFIVGGLAGGGGIAAFVGAAIASTLGAIPKALTDAFDGVLRGVGEIFSGLVGLASGAFQAIVNVASQILNGLVSIAQRVVTGITSAFSKLIGKVSRIFGKIVGGATAALAGMTGFAVRQIGQMDRTLAKAFGLIPKVGLAAFKEMRDGISKMARDIPYLGGTALAEGLFQAISAGARDPSRALEIVKQSAIAGVAGGLEEISEVVRAVTRTSAIFNREIKETTDLLFQAQNLGQLTFAELARGIGLVAGISRTAKVQLEDLLGVLAAGSRVLDPESLFTGVRRLVQTLAAPSPEAREHRAQLGINFKTYTPEEKKALDALEKDIAQKAKRLEDLLNRPFRGIRARQEVRHLREDIGELNRDLLDLDKASGKIAGLMTAIEMIERRGLSFEQIRGIIPEIRAAAVSLGVQSLGRQTRIEIKALMREFRGAAKAAYDIAQQQLPARLSRAWGSFRELVRGVYDEIASTLASALDGIKGRLDSLAASDVFARFKSSVASFASTALARVGDLVEYIIHNWDTIISKTEELWGAFKTGVSAAWEISKRLGGVIRDALDPSRPSKFRDAWEGIKRTLREASDIIIDISQGDFSSLDNASESLWDRFTTHAEIAWLKFKLWGIDAVDTIASALKGMIGGMESALFKLNELNPFRSSNVEEFDPRTLPPSAFRVDREAVRITAEAEEGVTARVAEVAAIAPIAPTAPVADVAERADVARVAPVADVPGEAGAPQPVARGGLSATPFGVTGEFGGGGLRGTPEERPEEFEARQRRIAETERALKRKIAEAEAEARHIARLHRLKEEELKRLARLPLSPMKAAEQARAPLDPDFSGLKRIAVAIESMRKSMKAIEGAQGKISAFQEKLAAEKPRLAAEITEKESGLREREQARADAADRIKEAQAVKRATEAADKFASELEAAAKIIGLAELDAKAVVREPGIVLPDGAGGVNAIEGAKRAVPPPPEQPSFAQAPDVTIENIVPVADIADVAAVAPAADIAEIAPVADIAEIAPVADVADVAEAAPAVEAAREAPAAQVAGVAKEAAQAPAAQIALPTPAAAPTKLGTVQAFVIGFAQDALNGLLGVLRDALSGVTEGLRGVADIARAPAAPESRWVVPPTPETPDVSAVPEVRVVSPITEVPPIPVADVAKVADVADVAKVADVAEKAKVVETAKGETPAADAPRPSARQAPPTPIDTSVTVHVPEVKFSRATLDQLAAAIRQTGKIPEWARAIGLAATKQADAITRGKKPVATDGQPVITGITPGVPVAEDPAALRAKALDEQTAQWGKIITVGVENLLRSGQAGAQAIKDLESVPLEVFTRLFPKGLFGDFALRGETAEKDLPKFTVQYPDAPKEPFSPLLAAHIKDESVERVKAIRLVAKEGDAKTKALQQEALLAAAREKFADQLLALEFGGIADLLSDVKRKADPRAPAAPLGKAAGITLKEGGFAEAFRQTFGRADAQDRAKAGLTKAELANAKALETQLRQMGAPVDPRAIREAVKTASQVTTKSIEKRGRPEIERETLTDILAKRLGKAGVEDIDRKKLGVAVGEATEGRTGTHQITRALQDALGEQGEKLSFADLRDAVREMKDKTSDAALRKNATLSEVAKSMLDHIQKQESADEKEIATLEKIIEIVTRNAQRAEKMRQRVEQMDQMLAGMGGEVPKGK